MPHQALYRILLARPARKGGSRVAASVVPAHVVVSTPTPPTAFGRFLASVYGAGFHLPNYTPGIA